MKIVETLRRSNKNIVINGDLASGKTFNGGFSIVKDVIDNGESFFVLDNRLEYLNYYYDELKSKDYEVVIINFDDANHSDSWNPLEFPYKLYKDGKVDETLNYLENISETLFYHEGESDPFWTLTSRDYFISAVIALFDEAKDNNVVNISSVGKILDAVDKKIGDKDFIRYYFENKKESSLGYRYASATIFAPVETKGGIVAVTRQNLRYLLCRESLNKLLAKSTFTLDKLDERKVAIFLMGNNIKKLPEVFIRELYTILVKSTHPKFNIIIDNFDDLTYLTELKDMLSNSVHYNMRFILILRDINNLYEKYGTYIDKLITRVDIDDSFQSSKLEEHKSNVVYPSLDNELKTIDFDSIIMDIEKNNPSVDIDGLMKKIDTKIAEIDKEMN